MDLAEAVKKASDILDEERNSPTVTYKAVYTSWEQPLQELTGTRPNLFQQRQNRPRAVSEEQGQYSFTSVNYGLLAMIFGQLTPTDRNAFMSSIAKRVLSGRAFRFEKGGTFYPRYDGYVSELPLLAEFFIRNGYTSLLLTTAASIPKPTHGLVLMLMQIEEMISLNFTIFSAENLEWIPKLLSPAREAVRKLTWKSSRPRGSQGPPTFNPDYVPGFEAISTEVVKAIDGIAEECRKALYFYLKNELQQTVNLEIENDKATVKSSLQRLGFSEEMSKVLDAAEQDYKADSNSFELKNCLSHLRSFVEHMHRETAKAIAAKNGDTLNDRWGEATVYLRNQNFYTKQHEAFAASLYTLISDESVHPLGADREYARLLRNVVIEYGVMFLSGLEKKGMNLSFGAKG